MQSSQIILRVRQSIPYAKLALKASLAPTLALVLTQVTPYANYFGGYGYVAAVAAMLALPVFPTGQFLRLLFLEILFTCIGAATTLLGMICAIQARSRPIKVYQIPETGALALPYDSNACVVAALFMALQMLIIGSLRGRDPLIDYPCCCWMVVTCFGLTYAPILPSIATGLTLVKQLTTSLMVGYGLSLVSALALFPNSCRSDLQSCMRRYASALHSTLSAYRAKTRQSLCEGESSDSAAVHNLRENVSLLSSLHIDLESRKQRAMNEFHFGCMTNKDLARCCDLLRATYAPVRGMVLLSDMSRAPQSVPISLSPQLIHLDMQQSAANLTEALSRIGITSPPDPAREDTEDVEMTSPSRTADSHEAFFSKAFSRRVTALTAFVSVLKRSNKRETRKVSTPALTCANPFSWLQPSRICHIGASDSVTFAAKMTCAILCAALPAWFEYSQHWYISHRLIWAQYAAGLTMHPSSGHTIFGIILRIAGTVIGTLMSMASWYAVVGNVTAVIVLFWVIQFVMLFAQFKLPIRFFTLSTTAIFTVITILGYQVEVQKLGTARVAASGTAIQDTLELSGSRFATIASGLTLAFVFVMFPSRYTEARMLQSRLARALDLLLQHLSAQNDGSLFNLEGPALTMKHTESVTAENAMAKTFVEIQTHLPYVIFDNPLSATFESDAIARVMERIEGLTGSISALAIAADAFRECTSGKRTRWLGDVQDVLRQTPDPTSQAMLLLSTCSASLSTGRPLPARASSMLSSFPVRGVDRQRYRVLLSMDNVSEPGFAAFSVSITLFGRVQGQFESLFASVVDIVGE